MNSENKSIGTRELQGFLQRNPELPLVFGVGDVLIKPGYHVTEIRHTAVSSIDCGRSSTIEQWPELVIQLLDGSQNMNQELAASLEKPVQAKRQDATAWDSGYMSSGKFLDIVGKAALAFGIEDIKALDCDRLFFEFAPDNKPFFKLSVQSVILEKGALLVSLVHQHAVCKPAVRNSSVCQVDGQVKSAACCAMPASSTDTSPGACCT